MSDHSFIREVNEEIRRDQAQAIWNRYGPVAIGLAILVIFFRRRGTIAVDAADRMRG